MTTGAPCNFQTNEEAPRYLPKISLSAPAGPLDQLSRVLIKLPNKELLQLSIIAWDVPSPLKESLGHLIMDLPTIALCGVSLYLSNIALNRMHFL